MLTVPGLCRISFDNWTPASATSASLFLPLIRPCDEDVPCTMPCAQVYKTCIEARMTPVFAAVDQLFFFSSLWISLSCSRCVLCGVFRCFWGEQTTTSLAISIAVSAHELAQSEFASRTTSFCRSASLSPQKIHVSGQGSIS